MHVGALQQPRQQRQTLRGGGEEESVTGLVISLVKNIVGSGMLALPAGVAAFSDSKNVVLLTVVFASIAASCAGYCFHLVGKVCLETGATSYKQAWVKTIGKKSSWVPTVFIAFKTFVACLCYSIIIADLARDLADSQGLTGMYGDRDALLSALTITVVLPLCMLRSFAALKFTSILGIVGVFASMAHMTYRWIKGDYAPGGAFFDKLPSLEKPIFDKKGTSALKSLILVSTLTSSFFAHYNAPKFLNEIKTGDRQKQFNKLSLYAFAASCICNSVMMVTGFLTFGGKCKGLILNNYSSQDQLANLARVGVLLSVVFGFPHSYVGLRDQMMHGILERFNTQAGKDVFAVVTLTILTVLAMKVKDLGVVVALFGALLGSMIIYVFPAMMMMAKRRNDVAAAAAKGASVSLGQEYYVNMGVAGLGVVFGTLGVIIVLLKNFTDVLK